MTKEIKVNFNTESFLIVALSQNGHKLLFDSKKNKLLNMQDMIVDCIPNYIKRDDDGSFFMFWMPNNISGETETALLLALSNLNMKDYLYLRKAKIDEYVSAFGEFRDNPFGLRIEQSVCFDA